MHLGIKRQAVAEWRDETILAAVDLLNRKAIIARAELDQEFCDATARDALFPSALANARIDAMTRDVLAPEIEAFMRGAALGLIEIDPALEDISKRLTGEPVIQAVAPMGEGVAPSATLEHDAGGNTTDAAGDEGRTPSAAWLTRLPQRLKRGATSFAESAGSAADVLISDTLGMSERIRSAAVKRVENEWLNDADNPDSALSRIVTAIDETAFSARVTLT